MQRFSFWLFLFTALYVSSPACATDEAPASGVPATVAPHIALILPLKSPVFGAAADAVRQGFLAAASSQYQTLPVRVYECKDESSEIATLYLKAVASGARAVVGPLTHSGVAALARFGGIVVPTLALNTPEDTSAGANTGPDMLYYFGLPAEAEARQVARLAAATGLHDANIITSGTPLSDRLATAFADEWKALGGNVDHEILYQDDPAVAANIPAKDGSMVFLAADSHTAHLIRPYLDASLPVYATSQLFSGNGNTLTNYDLDKIRFVDMPWLLQPDHPAVMIYPRPNPPLSAEMERLYALGIDAYRLVQVMLNNSYSTSLPLDGVTGRIRLDSSRQFQREAVPAQFRYGQGLTPEGVAAYEAALAAARKAAENGTPSSAVPPASVAPPIPAASGVVQAASAPAPSP